MHRWLMGSLVGLLGGLALAAGAQMVVKVKQTSIRESPQFYAPGVAVARFTDRLEVIETSGGWLHVDFSGKRGWVHHSAVAAADGEEEGGAGAVLEGIQKSLGLLSSRTSMETTEGYSENEVALAGKGFSAAVEEAYRRGNPGANYAAVDWLESQVVSGPEIHHFAQAGGLQSRPIVAEEPAQQASDKGAAPARVGEQPGGVDSWSR